MVDVAGRDRLDAGIIHLGDNAADRIEEPRVLFIPFTFHHLQNRIDTLVKVVTNQLVGDRSPLVHRGPIFLEAFPQKFPALLMIQDRHRFYRL